MELKEWVLDTWVLPPKLRFRVIDGSATTDNRKRHLPPRYYHYPESLFLNGLLVMELLEITMFSGSQAMNGRFGAGEALRVRYNDQNLSKRVI